MDMNFIDELPNALIAHLCEKKEYRKATEVVVANMHSNLIRMEAVYGKDSALRDQYNEVSFWGKDAGLSAKTEERILQLILSKHSLYMKRIRHILETKSDEQ